MVAFVINIGLVVEYPLSVTVCNVLVFHMVTAPVLALTAVSVPAVIEVTEAPTVAAVRIGEPFT